MPHSNSKSLQKSPEGELKMYFQRLTFHIVTVIIAAQPLHGEWVYEYTKLNWPALPTGQGFTSPANLTHAVHTIESGLPFRMALQSQERSHPTFYVSVPRFWNSAEIPAGLNIVGNGWRNNGVLTPYPNLELNKLGDCRSLQSPTGLVLDRSEYLYVVDMGRVDVLTSRPQNLCPAKLVVFHGGKVVRSYEFPDSVVSRTSNLLSDIVLDYVDPDKITGPKFAYISDFSSERKIVVVDLDSNTSWSVSNQLSTGPTILQNIEIHGELYKIGVGLSSIALTSDFNYVYYSVTGDKRVWEVPTWVLRSSWKHTYGWREMASLRCNVGALDAAPFGLFYGDIDSDAILRWDSHSDQKTLFLQNWETLQWTTSLLITKKPDNWNSKIAYATMYYLTSKMHLYFSGEMNFTRPHINFRIGKLDLPLDYKFIRRD